MRRFVALLGAAFLLTAATPARAGDSDPGTWWLSPAIQARMRMTPRQVCKLDVIYRASLPERRRRGHQLAIVREQLSRILAEGVADDARARGVVERLYALERDRNVTRTLMLFRMHQVLTPEQRGVLAAIGVRPADTLIPRLNRP